MPSLLISALDSSILSLLSWRFMRSLCLLSSLSWQAWMASAIMEALLEMAVPTSCVVLSDAVVAGALVPSPFPPPAAAFLLLFAGESEYSLVSESELLWEKVERKEELVELVVVRRRQWQQPLVVVVVVEEARPWQE